MTPRRWPKAGPSRSRFGAALIGLALCAGLLAPAGAQTPPASEPTPAAPPTSTDTAVRAIPIVRLPAEMAQSMDYVTNQGDTVAFRGRHRELSSAAATLLQDLVVLEHDADSLLEHDPSLRDVEALLLDWSDRQARVRRHIQTGKELSQHLFVRTATLDSLRQVWLRTRSQHAATLTPTRTARIDTLLQSVNRRLQIEGPLSERTDVLVSSLVDAEARIQRTVNRIRVAERMLRGQLLTRDAVPIWQASPSAAPGVGFWTEVGRGWRESWRDIQDFARREATGLILFGLFFLGIALLLLSSRKPILDLAAQGGEAKVASHVLGRPFGTAFLLTSLALVTIYKQAPAEIADFLALLIVLPFLRLALGVLDKTFRLPILALATLFILDHVGALLGENTFGWRLSLLLRSVVGALAFYELAWRLRSPQTAEIRLRPLYAAVSRVGLVLLGFGALANVLGFTTMAIVLTEGTLNSAVSGLVIVALTPVLLGMAYVIFQTPLVQASRYLRRKTHSLLRTFAKWARFLMAVTWVWIVLSLFRLAMPVRETLVAMLEAKFEVGAASISLAGVLSFILVAWFGVTLSRVLSSILEEDVLDRAGMPRGVPAAIGRVTQIALLALVFALAAATAGVELTQMALLTGALGVGIGFGMQNIVSNFISGLILMFERPIQVGDTVQVGTLTGKVQKIGFRSSLVQTFEGSAVIVPNANLISNEVINWTHSDQSRRIDLPVGVAYGTDPAKVLEILVQAAASVPEVSKDPAPVALFREFGDSSLNFIVRYWTNDSARWMIIASDVAVAVNDALKRAGIEIPFPQRTLHMASWAPGAAPPAGGGPAGGASPGGSTST